MIATELKFLDEIHMKALAKPLDVISWHTELFDYLYHLRQSSSASEWEKTRKEIKVHPLCNLLHEDPLTKRCFDKPRGYAGDAVMIDYIYGVCPPGISEIGQRLLEHMINYPAAKAVRYRRTCMAQIIDTVAYQKPGCRILSIACGHLREAEYSKAVQNRQLAEFIALDQDIESLNVVTSNYALLGIQPIEGNVKDILKGQIDLGSFDLIYATGLYDYLPQPIAQSLTLALFNMLNSQGQLIIPNFLPNIRDVGYMETFMDWMLIYRDLPTLIDTAKLIPSREISCQETWVEPYQNIGFLEIIRQ